MTDLRIFIETCLSSFTIGDNLAATLTNVLLVIIALALAASTFYLCHGLILPLVMKITRKTDIKWDDIIFNDRTMRAACKIVPAIVIWQLIPHIFVSHPTVMEGLVRLTLVYITITSLWLALAVIDSVKMLEGDRRTAIQQYYHTFCGVLKIMAICIAVIVITSIAIGRNPTTLFAGLGATSAILMLVFKDTITGLVAGIRLTSNNMIQKGDWITVPKANINGIVQDISLTTVKVLNFDNTIVTITPQTLVDDTFQNWKNMQEGGGRRVMRRIYFDFRSIQLADGELKRQLVNKRYARQDELQGEVVNMTLFRRYTERWLKANEDVNEDMLFMVRQLEATPNGLPVEIYFFLKQKTWKPYEQHLAGVMEHIYATIPDFGLRIYQNISDDSSRRA